MREKNRDRARPLAARMRPRTLDEFVGQEHFLGPGKLLRRMLLADRLSSLIFYGPPGTGKTALAQVIANHTQSKFRPLNATSTGTKEVREVLAEARADLETGGERTILFLDEMHRFNKSESIEQASSPIDFTLQLAQDSIQRKLIDFDPTGDSHYDLASAFIKSMRGSDPDAAIYWLARMLESGEDPRFIARRIVILASEDVGNADPQALVVAAAALQATEFVGLPECQLALAQAVTYIATAPKSNASTLAIGKARDDVRSGRTLAVPDHLRDAHYRGAEKFGHGEGYQYSHDFAGGWTDQAYLPEDRRYYEPVDRGYEAEIRKRLEEIRQKRAAGGASSPPATS